MNEKKKDSKGEEVKGNLGSIKTIEFFWYWMLLTKNILIVNLV